MRPKVLAIRRVPVLGSFGALDPPTGARADLRLRNASAAHAPSTRVGKPRRCSKLRPSVDALRAPRDPRPRRGVRGATGHERSRASVDASHDLMATERLGFACFVRCRRVSIPAARNCDRRPPRRPDRKFRYTFGTRCRRRRRGRHTKCCASGVVDSCRAASIFGR